MDILWLDDDMESFQYDYEDAIGKLKSMGHKTTIAETPSEAMEIIENKSKENKKFAFIILDILMGHHDKIIIDGKEIEANYGYDAGKVFYEKFLRINVNTKDLPIIIYTNIEEDPVFNEWVKKKEAQKNRIWYIKKSEGYSKIIDAIREI